MAVVRKLRQVFRFLLVLSMCAATAAYVSNVWSKYLEGNVGTTTEVAERLEFSFPSVSLCSLTASAGSSSARLIKGATQTSKLRNGSVGTTDFSPTSGDSTLWENRVFPRAREGVDLRCDTFMAPTAEAGFGQDNVLYLFVDVPTYGRDLGNEPLLHFNLNRADLLLDVAEVMENSVPVMMPPFRRSALKNLTQVRIYSLGLGERTRLNRKGRPCRSGVGEEEEARRMQRCLDNYMLKISPCDNTESIAEACGPRDYAALMNLTTSRSENTFVKLTGCLLPCTTPTYDVTLISTLFQENRWLVSFGTSDVILAFYFPRPSVTVVREYELYDLSSLAGDVGGMMGMLLGASVVAAYEWAWDAMTAAAAAACVAGKRGEKSAIREEKNLRV